MELIEEFSKGYWIVNADIVPFNGEKVTTSSQLGYEMLRYTGYPLLKIGNEHERVHTQSSVPAETIAVPQDVSPDGYDHALLAKTETAERLVVSGAV